MIKKKNTSGFSNRAEQLAYVFNRFIDFIQKIFKEMGDENPQLELLKNAPVALLCAKAAEWDERYGDELLKESMGTVCKLITDQSSDLPLRSRSSL